MLKAHPAPNPTISLYILYHSLISAALIHRLGRERAGPRNAMVAVGRAQSDINGNVAEQVDDLRERMRLLQGLAPTLSPLQGSKFDSIQVTGAQTSIFWKQISLQTKRKSNVREL